MTKTLPLSGIKVLEFSQMIMGPCCGLILADLGAEVIKIEPIKGDRTRNLTGLAAGFFDTFGRNKKSVALDLTRNEDRAVLDDLIAETDILIENFRPGMMKATGLDYESLKSQHPELIYCSLKGFLAGPYQHRTALDEVVQMMSGLAFMTGLPDRPLRTGASVNDIMGAMFGVIGIQAALRERQNTGLGQEVQASLYENAAFLMAPAMLAEVITGQASTPFSITERPWPAYDLFDLADGSKLFVGIVGDQQWLDFCAAFDRSDWLADPRLATNALRQQARSWLIPEIRSLFLSLDASQVKATVERLGLPFAPVCTPIELLDDPHLNSNDGMIDVVLSNGMTSKLPALPLTLGGKRLGGTRPRAPHIGEHTSEVPRASTFAAPVTQVE
ncbi:CoA transferase [Rhizobium leguminosarum bv. viciae]|nr:CoA transferase [Rhizobium leguminosarum bv. viciae]